MSVFLKVLAGILAGYAVGVAVVYGRLRRGLTSREWLFLRDFYTALKAGYYEDCTNKERSEDDEEH